MFVKYRRSFFAFAGLLIASIVLLGAGCSESTSPEDDGGGGDNTPPELSSVTPIDEYHIEVVFTEDVDEVTAQHPEE